MDRCANTEALAAYENQQAKEELAYEQFQDFLEDSELYTDFEMMQHTYEQYCRDHGYEGAEPFLQWLGRQ